MHDTRCATLQPEEQHGDQRDQSDTTTVRSTSSKRSKPSRIIFIFMRRVTVYPRLCHACHSAPLPNDCAPCCRGLHVTSRQALPQLRRKPSFRGLQTRCTGRPDVECQMTEQGSRAHGMVARWHDRMIELDRIRIFLFSRSGGISLIISCAIRRILSITIN
jgi:hypothetical protein